MQGMICRSGAPEERWGIERSFLGLHSLIHEIAISKRMKPKTGADGVQSNLEVAFSQNRRKTVDITFS
jgi:hypothetical protein